MRQALQLAFGLLRGLRQLDNARRRGDLAHGERHDVAGIEDDAVAVHKALRAGQENRFARLGKAGHDATRDQRLRGLLGALQIGALIEARRRANLCTQLERGELDRATVNRLWDGEVTLPSRWAERLRDRLQASIPGDAAESARRTCTQLEALAGIETPAHDEPLRLAMQVERLNRQFSMGVREDRSYDEQVREALLERYCLPITGNAELDERLEKAERALLDGQAAVKAG